MFLNSKEATRRVISTDKIIETQKTSNSDQPLATSSANLKENEADTSILDTFSSKNLPGSESKASKSPRPQSRPGLIHRESVNSFHDRSGSVNSETSLYGELIEAPMVDQEDIIALTHHVRAFSEALSALRNTFFELTGIVHSTYFLVLLIKLLTCLDSVCLQKCLQDIL